MFKKHREKRLVEEVGAIRPGDRVLRRRRRSPRILATISHISRLLKGTTSR